MLSDLGHEVIVANCAQGTADRGEPQERRSAGCADAGPVGPDRSEVAVSGEAPQRAGASRSDVDSGASWTGACAHGAGQHGARAGQELRGAIARVQRAQYESGESRRPESRAASRTGTPVERNRVAERAHRGIQRAHRESGTAELSAGGAVEAGKGGGYADLADLLTDDGKRESLWQESRRGLLSGTAAGAQELGPRASRSCISAKKAIPICGRCWCKERSTSWVRSGWTVICGAGA